MVKTEILMVKIVNLVVEQLKAMPRILTIKDLEPPWTKEAATLKLESIKEADQDQNKEALI